MGERESDIPFMKVDAQGFDFRVLRGAMRLLRSGRVGVLVFEYCLPLIPRGRDEAAEGFGMLRALGADCMPCNDWTVPRRWQVHRPMGIAEYVAHFNDTFDNIVCRMRGARDVDR